MIDPGDLHRHHKVRVIATGRETSLLNGDVRYSRNGSGVWGYLIDPEGECILVASAVYSHLWGVPVRLDEIEAIPDGRGIWHPDWDDMRALKLSMTYEGSWRQFADRQRTEQACTQLELFG